MRRTETKIPVVVDLDGTLILSDSLIENIFAFLRCYPLAFIYLFFWIFLGKAEFKRRLADYILPDVSHFPFNQDLIIWLKKKSEDGCQIILASAADIRIVSAVSKHLGIFNQIIGTDRINLSSDNKRDELIRRFGFKGFDYVGNSKDDLSVWRSSSKAYIANPELGVLSSAKKIGEIERIFYSRPNIFITFLKAIRLHQWIKNFLVFLPLLASHAVLNLDLISSALIAFICFGFCASSVYLLNDLLDLQDDRKHKTKKNRPLASGALPITHAVFSIPLLLSISFMVSYFYLPQSFSYVLASYYVLTLAYSLWFKRFAIFDVVVLALLYTIRVIAGASATHLTATFWMLAFCMFIFLSLAFVKRYTEVRDARNQAREDKLSGRGYYAEDFELLASLGGSSGYIAVLVLAFYINDPSTKALYSSPQWMWAGCPILIFWISRLWLLSHRGEMHEDPIVFALKDSLSRWLGAVFVLAFVMAV